MKIVGDSATARVMREIAADMAAKAAATPPGPWSGPRPSVWRYMMMKPEHFRSRLISGDE